MIAGDDFEGRAFETPPGAGHHAVCEEAVVEDIVIL